MIKVNIHSIVDVITNSSTVIYTTQDSIEEAKELVQEVLNLMGIKDKTPDDIFYYGVFPDHEVLCDYIDDYSGEDEEDFEGWYNDNETSLSTFPKYDPNIGYKEMATKRTEWFNNIKLKIMKNEIRTPEWMERILDRIFDYSGTSTFLYLYPKDDKFKGLADKISKLLNSVVGEDGGDR